MRTIHCIILLSLLAVSAKGQPGDQITDSTLVSHTLVSQYRTNFAIPNVAAYEALQVNPSNILRPSNVKEVALILDNLFNNTSFIIPDAIGVEIAPWLLTSKKQLAEYRESGFVRFLHRTSLSVAATRGEEDNDASKLAFGIRTSFVGEEGDIKRNTKALEEIFAQQGMALKIRNDLLNEFLKVNNLLPQDLGDVQTRQQLENFIQERLPEISSTEEQLHVFIAEYIEAFKRENWNHKRLDLAFTITGISEDTVVRVNDFGGDQLKFGTVSLWATGALPVKKWGQILLGFQTQYSAHQTDSLEYQVSIPARFYAGTNRIKGFVEAQATFTNLDDNYLLDAGTEINITDGIWINLYAGMLSHSAGGTSLVTHFDIRFTIPENFSLF